MLDFTVESSGKEAFTIMRKLGISDCLCMADVGVSAGAILYEIE